MIHSQDILIQTKTKTFVIGTNLNGAVLKHLLAQDGCRSTKMKLKWAIGPNEKL